MAGDDMAEKQICQRMQKMIQPYLDDELSGRDSAQFIAHIRDKDSEVALDGLIRRGAVRLFL